VCRPPLPADTGLDTLKDHGHCPAHSVATPNVQAYIQNNQWKYKVTLAGFEDYVGDSNVLGPTMQPPGVSCVGQRHT
jgi:hypothetical protein